MSIAADDYRQRWRNFLSYGAYYFSEELLTPDIGLIVSPDGSNISVIDDDKNLSLCKYYNEEEKAVFADLRFLWRIAARGVRWTPLNCPACGQFYRVSFDHRSKHLLGNAIVFYDEQPEESIIYISSHSDYFECACGVIFNFNDRYKYLRLPFDLQELEPLYKMRMSRTADLLVRYVLSTDGHSLVEDIGAIARMPNSPSLTDNPLRAFSWAIPPCFTSECRGRDEGIHDVQIWRRRAYVFGCDRFVESTWNHYANWGRTVIRYHRFKDRDVLSVFTPPDELLNNSELFKSLLITNESQLSQFGDAQANFEESQANDTSIGGRPVKFEPEEKQIKDFAPQYEEATCTLDKEMKMRRLRQFGRYIDAERLYILKRAYPDAPDDLIRLMSYQVKASHVALHYAFWKIGGPVGVWRATQLNELLKESRKIQPKRFSD